MSEGGEVGDGRWGGVGGKGWMSGWVERSQGGRGKVGGKAGGGGVEVGEGGE